MRRLYRFALFLAWFAVLEALHVLVWPSYWMSIILAAVTIGVLYVPKVQRMVLLHPIVAGITVLVSSALVALFLRDNVYASWSLASLLTPLAVFTLTYLLVQSKLERPV